MTALVAIDVGGTHARFALAEVRHGQVVDLGEAVTLKTAEHASFQTAWQEFGRRCARPLPGAAAIAVAGPVTGEVIKFTNNPWVLHPGRIDRQLAIDAHVLVNDFEAVGYAVAQACDEYFQMLCGPDVPLPATGTISVLGPGTGLGVAHVWRGAAGFQVHATEGGHIDFAPLDAIEDAILARLRGKYRRVSVERMLSGPGLVDIHEALAAIEGRPVQQHDDKALWGLAMSGEDALATAALDRFCLSLGSVAGDIALAQGASAVVIAGGLGLRLADRLPRSGFAQRFRAKGRFEAMMAGLPVKLITHPQPGLFGAAVAFARRHP